MPWFIPFLVVILFSVQPALGQVDYRIYQSPVKNQAGRGTCTAFAILSALETFPGFPCDLSEQYLYAMAKLKHHDEMPNYNQGAFLQFYTDVLQWNGTVREDQDPYGPNAPVWNEGDSDFEKFKKEMKGRLIHYLKIFPSFTYRIYPDWYQYLHGQQAKNVEYIKQRLDEGVKNIPVTYEINDQFWFGNPGSESNPIDPSGFIEVNDGEAYYGMTYAKLLWGDKLFDMIDSGSITPYSIPLLDATEAMPWL